MAFLGLSFFFGAVSGILSGIIYKRSTTIVMHPLNNTWDPTKLMKRETPYRYVYRSRRRLIRNKAMVSQALISLSDEFAVYLSENSRRMRENKYLFMACRTGEIVELLSNKVKLSTHRLQEFLPETYDSKNISYPCILKYGESAHSSGVFRIEDKDELDSKTLGRTINEDYIIQEAILDSRECSTQFIVHDGKIVFHSSYYDEYDSKLFIWPRDKSISTIRFRLDDEKLKVFEEFFVDYNGLINCNYKVHDGHLKILEFNPRLSGDIYAMSKTDLNELVDVYLKHASEPTETP
jgi:predicted ATP-grasp superfamily ATP-dependent carboligase